MSPEIALFGMVDTLKTVEDKTGWNETRAVPISIPGVGEHGMSCRSLSERGISLSFFPSGVLVDKRTSEETEMMIRKSAGHSTDEASNDRGGKDPR